MDKKTLLSCLIFITLWGFYAELYCQVAVSEVVKRDSIIPLKERFAVRTNVVDWAFLLPNIGAEFDIFGQADKNYTIGLNLKGNWTTTNLLPDDFFYDMSVARVEFKRYIRATQRTPKAVKFKDRLSEFFSWRKNNPRSVVIAYYLGAYADFGKYNFKFGDVGHKGKFAGVGFTFGFGKSLYKYDKGSIDLEIGGSIGVAYSKYDDYQLAANNIDYQYLERDKTSILPVVSDVRVAFVYRFGSIDDKYKENKKTVRDRLNDVRIKRESARVERKERNDSIRAEKERLKEESVKIKNSKVDSLADGKKVKGKRKGLFSKLFGKKKDADTLKIEVISSPKDSLIVNEADKNVVEKKSRHDRRKNESEVPAMTEATSNSNVEVDGKEETKDSKKSRRSKKAKKKENKSEATAVAEVVSNSNVETSAKEETRDSKKSRRSKKAKKKENKSEATAVVEVISNSNVETSAKEETRDSKKNKRSKKAKKKENKSEATAVAEVISNSNVKADAKEEMKEGKKSRKSKRNKKKESKSEIPVAGAERGM